MNTASHAAIDRLVQLALLGEQDLLTRYDTYFYTQAADTPRSIQTALALRYQVYCLERKFENPEQHLDQLEKDEFDRQAVHSLIFHRPRAEAIGTVRLILPESRADTLPIQNLLRESDLNASDFFPIDTTGEVSRFAISNEFRRRSSDQASDLLLSDSQRRREMERRSNLPCLGLIQSLLRQSRECGIDYWAAVMEPKLLRMLAGMGIRFTSIGPLVMHHGIRQPSYCYVPQMLETLWRERPDYWNIVTNAGELTLPKPLAMQVA